MTGSQEDTTSGFALSNKMASCRCAHNAILTDQKLLDSICSSNLSDQLNDLWVPESSISANDQKASFGTFWDGKQNASDERFTVVWLLEDGDLFPQAGSVYSC